MSDRREIETRQALSVDAEPSPDRGERRMGERRALNRPDPEVGALHDADPHHPGAGDEESHGPATEHHGEEPLGPIDVRAWGATLVGLGAGLGIALLFWVASSAN